MDLSPAEFRRLSALAHRLCGLALTDDKEYLIRHRLEPVARAAGCDTFAAFLKALDGPAGPGLRDPIIEAVTTNETAFFRDGHPFEAFARHILPGLAARRLRDPSRPARVWSAAASTGQEPYSLAMLAAESRAVNAAGGPQDFTLLATDVSAKALAVARAGRYTDAEAARGLSPDRLRRHFARDGRHWVAADRLRGAIDFRRLNLTEGFGHLPAMDVIFCRNVLIYFDEPTRRGIVDRFAANLPPGGLLVLGAVENLYGITDRFASERVGGTTVYRRV